jgi:hypothetical protein
MNKIEVKKEYLAKKCEVCHKRDYFNIDTNFCSSCSYLKNNIYEIDVKNRIKFFTFITENKENRKSLRALYGSFIGIVIGPLLAILINIPPLLSDAIRESWYTQTGWDCEGYSPPVLISKLLIIKMALIYGAFLGVFFGLPVGLAIGHTFNFSDRTHLVLSIACIIVLSLIGVIIGW